MKRQPRCASLCNPIHRFQPGRSLPKSTWAALIAVLLLRSGWVHGQLTPAEERRTFEFADRELAAELVAAEPRVVSPVAIAWDARGRLFVAEMRDYPNATDGGSVRLLEDRDRDGSYETAQLFATGLAFPNSVVPWRDGLLVTTAPDLIFLRDTDGDGRADERTILFSGFGTGNQQLRANGLTWGLDGWIYGANGRSDGAVITPGTTNAVSLRGRDFRFQPDTGRFETVAGRSQFGLARDRWGNRFLSWNTIPIRHEVMPDRLLARNPALAGVDVLVDLLPPGDTGEVFPLTPPPLVFNNESSSHFNALAGLTLYQGDALGPAYRDNAFVGETLRNLVHRRILEPAGSTFTARRGEQRTEFLRSSDPWFHPVNFATGPDGALYVIDFYRRFVEHPDFVPREMRDKVGWRSGSEHGRIWRVGPSHRPQTQTRGRSNLDGAASRTLVRHLQHPNGWQRETAQRLLVERRATDTAPALRRTARNADLPEARALALRTLSLLGSLDHSTLIRALADEHPRVREQGAALSAEVLEAVKSPATTGHHPLANALASLSRDVDARVRLQAALALGSLRDDSLRETTLGDMLEVNTEPWIRLAAISSSRTLSAARVAELLPSPARPVRRPPVPASPDPDRARVVAAFGPALKLAGDRTQGAATFAKLCLACHYLQGHGQRVGPDLSGISTRPVEALLVDVLDPSRQVAPDYATYEILDTSGETSSGLLVSETETRITLRHAGAPDETIARSRIRSVRATARSLMPDGLEAGLTAQDLADLLQFLRSPDGSLLGQP